MLLPFLLTIKEILEVVYFRKKKILRNHYLSMEMKL